MMIIEVNLSEPSSTAAPTFSRAGEIRKMIAPEKAPDYFDRMMRPGELNKTKGMRHGR